MDEFREAIFQELTKFLADNYKIFPIVNQIREYELLKIKSKGVDLDYRVHYAVMHHTGVKFIFNDYYNSLMKFWYVSDVVFKDDFKNLVIKACAYHYVPNIVLTQKLGKEISKAFEKFEKVKSYG